MKTIILLIFLCMANNSLPAQTCTRPFNIVVLGSSTAYGKGASTPANAWVNRYQAYLNNINASYKVINLAVIGYSTYEAQPDSFVPDAGRPTPVAGHNISRALQLKPDAIILNFPSNDVEKNYSLDEIEANFKRITDSATLAKVPVWVSTTQPRNGFDSAKTARQDSLFDWITNYYGIKSIDFKTGLASTADSLLSMYDSGDGIHFNDSGHAILFARVVAKNIPDTLCARTATPPFSIQSLSGTKTGNNIQLNWATPYEYNTGTFSVQRGTDSIHFTVLGKIIAAGNSIFQTNYSFLDTTAVTRNNFTLYYRLLEVDKNKTQHYSDIISVANIVKTASFTIAPNPAKDFFRIYSFAKFPKVLVKITDINGNLLYSKLQNFSSGQQVSINTAGYANGIYFVSFQSADIMLTLQLLISR